MDPKTVDLKDGKKLTKLRLADNPPVKRSDRDKNPARFISAKAFGPRGEALAKLRKGDVITATGCLTIETYDGKDGTKGQDDVLVIDQYRVQKSPTYFNEDTATPTEGEALDALFGGQG